MIRKINLQLFAQEKSEKATPKKRQEARKKGQVAKSQEINSALILLGTFLVLRLYFPYMMTETQEFIIKIYNSMHQQSITTLNAYNMLLEVLYLSIKLVAPLMGLTLFIGMTASYLQIGFIFSTEPLKIKLERLNPIEGFKKIFSKKSIVELVKSIFKISAVSIVVYLTLKSQIYVFARLLDTGVYPSMLFLGKLIFEIAWKVALLLVILAFIDVVYQRWEHDQSIKMSKHDVKEEYKQTEGNPQIKSKIKEKQRQIAMSRMMQDVPRADVIITNPVHLAIAIQYKEGMAAPKVLAKGQAKIAEKIKEIGSKHYVPVVENKPLAQTLFQTVEVGDLIPPDLYQAVAEVMAFVYQVARQRGGNSR